VSEDWKPGELTMQEKCVGVIIIIVLSIIFLKGFGVI